MLLRITNNEHLFNKWCELENFFRTPLLASVVQNEYIIPAEAANEEFKRIFEVKQELAKVYQPDAIQRITDLEKETFEHIKQHSEPPLTEEEFNFFRLRSCRHFCGQFEHDDIQRTSPVLTLCEHPNTPEVVEGNCNMVQCPYLQKKAQ